MLNESERAVLAASRLFCDTAPESIVHLLESCERRTQAASEVLLEPGVPNSHLFVILSGELRVYLGGRDLPQHTVLGVGDCVGEISLIDGQKVSAHVIAAKTSELLAIPHDTLWAMIESSHSIARNLLGVLAGRLRRDNLRLVSAQSLSLEFEEAGSVDSLTGLHNRRWMTESFTRMLRRCEQDAAPACLIMADIDHFKYYNDTYGHLVGDSILRLIAHTVAESLRPQDLVARYGGEEFALLLPLTGMEEGMKIADRLRAAVASRHVAIGENRVEEKITLSCGIAPFLIGDTLESLIALAEAALADAKQAGRDCVVMSRERA